MTQLPIVSADTTTESTGGCGCGGACGGGGGAPTDVAALAEPGDLVVSQIPAGERHATIFAAVAELAPGESMVIANNHAPEPLRVQLEQREPGQVTWEYLAEGPEVWRVKLSRVAGHCC